MQQIAYTALSLLFCGAWSLATVTVYRTRWYRVSPWFCVWLTVQTAQAVLNTIGGRSPSLWWTRSIWFPGEVVALLALFFALAEILPRRLGLIAAFAGIVMVPLFHDWQPLAPQLLAEFAAFREWVWATVAISLWAHLALLLWHPMRLAPGAFRLWVILACYATLMAATGLLGSSAYSWLPVRSIYRAGAIVHCLLWVRLAPQMRAASALPDPEEPPERRTFQAYPFSWLPAPRLICGPLADY